MNHKINLLKININQKIMSLIIIILIIIEVVKIFKQKKIVINIKISIYQI